MILMMIQVSDSWVGVAAAYAVPIVSFLFLFEIGRLMENKQIQKIYLTHIGIFTIGFSLVILIGELFDVSTRNTWFGLISVNFLFITLFKMLFNIARIITKENKNKFADKSEEEKRSDALSFIPTFGGNGVAYWLYFIVFVGSIAVAVSTLAIILSGELR